MQNLKFIGDKYVDKMVRVITPLFKLKYKPGERIAVKLHMGEFGNINYLRPVWARLVVDALKEAGARPFIFDSTALYHAKRSSVEDYLETAKKHGYSEDTMGCPIVISDEGIAYDTSNLKVMVCKDLAEADGMVVLTHVKGHSCTGIGASIKNLGMGGVCSSSKKDIHDMASAVWDAKKCTRCRRCLNVCPSDLISMKGMDIVIREENCFGCGACISNCLTKALKPRKAMFETLIAEGAFAVVKQFNPEKLYYINIMMDLSKLCDCVRGHNPIILPNVGILLGDDIVAIDKASLDLINKVAGKRIYDDIHKRPSVDHIIEAEKLGMGSLQYSVEDVS
jgi:uncharacterized Fe-S center protein